MVAMYRLMSLVKQQKAMYVHMDNIGQPSQMLWMSFHLCHIPIILVRVCGHMAVCNSLGLERLKEIKEFSEIEAYVEMDTGVLRENAVQFYYSVLEAPSQEEVEDYILHGIEKMNACGFTGIQSDDLASLPGKQWRRIMNAYQALDAKDALNMRVYEQCLFERIEDAKAFVKITTRFETTIRANIIWFI